MALRAAVSVLGSVIGHIRRRLFGMAPGAGDLARVVQPLRVAALAGERLAVKAGLVPVQRKAREMLVVHGGLGHVAVPIARLRPFDPPDSVGIRVRRHAGHILSLGALFCSQQVAVLAPVGCQTANRRVAVQALFPVRGVGAVAPGRLAVRVRGSEHLRVVAPPDLVGGATLADHQKGQDKGNYYPRAE